METIKYLAHSLFHSGILKEDSVLRGSLFARINVQLYSKRRRERLCSGSDAFMNVPLCSVLVLDRMGCGARRT